MVVLTIVVSVLLAAVMTQSALRKAMSSKDSLALRDRLSVAPSVWVAVGFLEAFAAVGLLAGLHWPVIGVAAAVGVLLVMLGAVLFHLRAHLYGAALIAPAAVGLMAVAAAASRLATAGLADV